MPTTATTFSGTEINTKYQEQYTSQSIDLKVANLIPRGIYKGFKLTTSGSALTVTVAADVTDSDHVANYLTSGGQSLTIRKTGGNFSIDLTAYASKTVAIAIYCTYSTVAATTAVIRIYEISPSDEFTIATEFDELIVLGKVVVPAAGLISASSITNDYRIDAYQNVVQGAVPRQQCIQNYSFERAILNSTAKYAAWNWELNSPTNTQSWITNTDPFDGGNSYELNLTSAATITGTILTQKIGIPAFGGAILKVRLQIKCLKAASSGTLACTPFWRQSDGDTNNSTAQTIAINAVDGSYRDIDLVFVAPSADSDAILLESIRFSLSGANYTIAGTGPAIRIDNVQAWLDQENVLNSQNTSDKQRSAINAGIITLEAADALFTDSDTTALISYDNSTKKLSLERLDQDSTSIDQPILDIKGQQILGSNLLTSDAKAILPRISTPYSVTGGVDYTLIWKSEPASGTDVSSRLYINNINKSIFFVNNASWGGTNWTRDNNANGVKALELNVNGMYVYSKASGVGTFTTFDETSISISAAGDDTNIISNTLDFGFNFNQSLPATTPRVYFQAYAIGTEDRTQLFENLAGDASNGHNRIYLTSTGNLEITKNCSWNGTAWARDFAANATKLLFDGSQLKLFIKLLADTGTPWNDSSWGTTRGYTLDLSNSTLTNIDGIYKITSATTGASGSNCPQTTAITNELRAKNITKSFGSIHVGSGGLSISGSGGFNIASTSATSGTIARVTFAAAMLSTDYIVMLTLDGTGLSTAALIPWIVDKQTTYFEFSVLNTSAAAQTLTSGTEYLVSYVVHGAQ